MATATQISEHRSLNDQLTKLAFADIVSLLDAINSDNPLEFRNTLMDTLPDVLQPYVTASGELSAAWYQELRQEVSDAVFVAEPVADISRPQVEALSRWAVSPLFGQSESTVLSLLAGGAQRMIEAAARETIAYNAMQDEILVGYQRIPQLGCCAFCGLLASRGAVYRDSAEAGGVVGRGVDASVTAGKRGGQGKGVKTRGSQNLGDRFHDFCRCVVTPIFIGGDNAYATATRKQYDEMYSQAVSGELSDYSERHPTGPQFEATTLKATLKTWRKDFGTR